MGKTRSQLNEKRGYLDNNFIFFNLQDTKEIQIESHSHDFNKIVIFISGTATYYIEGIAYKLKPWDILLINHDTIHKPLVDTIIPYRRMILWIRPNFLQNYSNATANLLACFELADQHKFNLVRMSPDMLTIIQSILFQINSTCQNDTFGDEVLRSSLFIQFIVYLNRMAMKIKQVEHHPDIECDETISSVLKYIDNNIADNLSIENLASIFFLSKYYLMRKFKHHTGYSLHNYILQKRLIVANQLIRGGQSVMMACMESGFHDYSNFTRAFKKLYGMPPKKHLNWENTKDPSYSTRLSLAKFDFAKN
jgi:AraC-like DNA-binding protein